MTTAWSLWPIGCSDAPPLLEPQLGTTGALSISTVTAGGEFDLDGYVVLLDGASSGRIDLSASLMLPGLEPSDRSVELADLAPNCSVTGSSHRNVPVAAGKITSVVFALTCTASPELGRVRIVFTSNDRSGTAWIYPMRGDGTELTMLAEGFGPSASPNGTKIAFARYGEYDPFGDWSEVDVHVMDANGADVERLTFGGNGSDAEWSPDGARIAFSAGTQIYLMNADGIELAPLSGAWHHYDPAWSPDGRRIALTAEDQSGEDLLPAIWITNADGTGLAPLTTLPSAGPVWSPDGSKIAFTGNDNGRRQLYVMNADGSGVVPLTTPMDARPGAWSPDGARIAFTGNQLGNSDLYLMDPDGTGIVRLTADPSYQGQPAFWPDGRAAAQRSR